MVNALKLIFEYKGLVKLKTLNKLLKLLKAVEPMTPALDIDKAAGKAIIP